MKRTVKRHCCARTFKTPGPWIFSKLFSKPVLCVPHYFYEFYIRADKYFPWFCMNSSFNCIFRFLTVVYILNCFQGPSILTWGTLSHRSHVFQQFPLYLASLVWCHEKIFDSNGDSNGSEEKISGLGLCSFQKNTTFLRSFAFFIKERFDLCVLLRSL